jgi:copper(I)-binding protein
MQTLKQVKQTVSDAGLWHHFQVIMVSVDPERDSLDRLAKYVPFFDPEFIGIAGSVEHTTEFAKNLGILFFKGEEASPGAYDVDHSAALVLINPQGQYAGVISAPHQHDDISADLIALANYQGSNASGQQVDNASPMEAQATSSTVGNDDSDNNGPVLVFEDAWIRPAPPNATSMAAYFNLRNASDSSIEVTDAQSPAFSMVMIHNTVMQDGVASMQHLDGVTLEPGDTLAFAPMGTHVMLIGPKKPLAEGDSAELTLIDAQGNEHTTEVFVRTPAVR